MAATLSHALSESRTKTLVGRWYFTGMAMVMIVVSVAGFLPAIVQPAGRRAPLTLLAAAHGIVFLAWLLLFLTQSLLVATGRVGWHRRLGWASVFLLALILPLSFTTTVELARRGYDLSGDQHIVAHPKPGRTLELDAATGSVFNFVGLFMFAVLAIAAICYRRRPEIHKRLMLFANIELMGPPITHLLGHFPSLVLTPGTVLLGSSLFLLAAVARDYLVAKRIHPLTAWLAIGIFMSFPLQGAVIGPSAAWHSLIGWLAK
jgi:hypothetical protein